MTRVEEFLEIIDQNMEHLETTDGDVVECISRENLKAELENYFGDEKADK